MDYTKALTDTEIGIIEALESAEDDKAMALSTLAKWGAGESLASYDDKLGVASALRTLGVEGYGYYGVWELDDLPKEEVQEIFHDYYGFDVDWDDEDDIRTSWASACSTYNAASLEVEIRVAFNMHREYFESEFSKINTLAE